MDGEWISASAALASVAKTADIATAAMTICARAHAGLLEAKAARLVWHDRSDDDCMIPKEFWWARGNRALKQNWSAGDFETWIDHKYRLIAYGVTFKRSGIEAIIAAAGGFRREAETPANPGGRQAAAWWDDLWIEMCRQLYVGDLKPNRQADIASAMMKWATDHGHQPADSTIRERARKLWKALETDAGN